MLVSCDCYGLAIQIAAILEHPVKYCHQNWLGHIELHYTLCENANHQLVCFMLVVPKETIEDVCLMLSQGKKVA